MTPAAALAVDGVGEIERHLRAVPPPVPLLDRAREQQLTDRQRQILDDLGTMFEDGFADLTMATIAARSHCSLQTLYGLAPSRNELVLMVVDRKFWIVGRQARRAIGSAASPLGALVAYIRAANKVAGSHTEAFLRDLGEVPAAQRLERAHGDYVVGIVRALLDLAVEQGEIRPVDTAAVAEILAVSAVTLSRPDVARTLAATPTEAANGVAALLVDGMRTRPRGQSVPRRGRRTR